MNAVPKSGPIIGPKSDPKTTLKIGTSLLNCHPGRLQRGHLSRALLLRLRQATLHQSEPGTRQSVAAFQGQKIEPLKEACGHVLQLARSAICRHGRVYDTTIFVPHHSFVLRYI